MRKILLFLGVTALAVVASPWTAQAQVNVGVAIGSNGVDAFHLAIGDYFKVSTEQIQNCQESGIPDEEHPVVFFIAQRANVSPEAVILLRTHGWSWMQIALHFRLNPRIFYTAGDYAGTPYANGQRVFIGHGRKINLSDADIVNFVNLKFISEHYGRDPHEIAQMRASGRNFRDINNGYMQKKEVMEWDAKERPRGHYEQGRDRGFDREHRDDNR
jgi:hypothetical protein